MKRKRIIRPLALGIVVLFIGFNSVQVINANQEKTSSKGNLIHKLINDVLKLSKEDFTKIESLLTDIENKFQEVKTNKEKLTIIKKAANLCNEKGLLPMGLSLGLAEHFMIIKYLIEEQDVNNGFFLHPRYQTTDGHTYSMKESRKNDFFVNDHNVKTLKSNVDGVEMDGGNHPSIYIYSNENFTADNGVIGGSGTPEDPYIIANWIITSNGSSSSGIIIHNTDAYFIIRNCTVSGYLNIDWYSGIKFTNVINGKIEDLKVYHNSRGIYVEKSSYIEIVNCTCHDNQGTYCMGIFCLKSSYVTIDSCKCYNDVWGIYLWYSSHCTIENTSCYNHDFDGIAIETDTTDYPVEYNVIRNCKLYNNYNDGIFIVTLFSSERHVGNNLITGCEIYNNGHLPGINNAFEGITIGYVNNNIIENCDIHHNGLGVYLFSSNNIVRNCTIHDQWEPGFAGQGLQIQGSFVPFLIIVRNNTIEHCNIYNQDIGVAIYDSLRTYIRKNNIYDNKFIGIELVSFYWIFGLTTVWIKENNICGNGYINGVIYASGLYTEGLGFVDGRNNWWNSTLGPTKMIPNLRGDRIYNIFWLTINRYRPWAKQPFPDAGQQT